MKTGPRVVSPIVATPKVKSGVVEVTLGLSEEGVMVDLGRGDVKVLVDIGVLVVLTDLVGSVELVTVVENNKFLAVVD